MGTTEVAKDGDSPLSQRSTWGLGQEYISQKFNRGLKKISKNSITLERPILWWRGDRHIIMVKFIVT